MAQSYSVEAILKVTGVSQFKKSFDDAIKSISDFEKIGSNLSSVGNAMKDLGGNMSKYITAPIAGAVTASIWQFADLEQAVGGIETLFKSSADAVIKNSETAYKRAGVSGVDYMENVTSFSASLLSGLGGDTEAAAKIADMAMVDMSDNANKMGTNIESIQNAYQGFAKGTFNMLDNLKLGYGGTQSEMARLINDSGVMGKTFKATAKNMDEVPFDKMIEAIHVIQTEMDITGTTVLEAEETVSGAFGMMKASLSDLAAGFGQEGANIDQFIQNLIDSVGVFADNIIRVLKTMWDNLPIPDWAKWLGGIIFIAGPIIGVIGTILSAIGGFATAIEGTSGIVGAFTALFPNVVAGFGLLKGAIGIVLGPIGLVVGAIAGAIAILVHLYKTNEEFRDKVNAIWTTIKGAIMGVVDIVVSFVSEKVEQLTTWWNENQEQMLAKVSEVWNGITDTIANVINAVLDFVTNTFGILVAWWNENQEQILMTASNVWNTIDETISSVINAVVTFVTDLFGGLVTWWQENNTMIMEAATNVWNVIKTVVSVAIGVVVGVITVGINIIKSIMEFIWPFVEALVKFAWDGIKNVIEGAIKIITGIIEFFSALFTGNWTALWESIKQIVSGVVQAVWGFIQLWIVGKVIGAIKIFVGLAKTLFSGVWTIIKNIFSTSLSWIWGKVTSIFSSISGSISGAMGTIKGVISSGLGSVKGFFTNIFGSLKGVVSTAFNSVKTAISGGMNTALSTLTNFLGKFKTAGSNIVGNIAKGITGAIGKVTGAIGGVLTKARTLLPFSPPKDKSSPMVDIHRNGITEQIAKGIYAGQSEIDRAMKTVLSEPTIDINGSIARSNAQIGSHVSHEISNDGGGRIEQLLAQIANNGQVIVLDSGELVGATYPQYDRVGGNQTQITERWGR